MTPDEGKRHLWVMDGDGQHRQQLRRARRGQDAGRLARRKHIVFLSNRSGPALWLMDSRQNPRQRDGRQRRVAAPVRAGRTGPSFEMEQGAK
jgi:hypothetical protein